MKPLEQHVEVSLPVPLVAGENPLRFLVELHPLEGEALRIRNAAKQQLLTYRTLVARTNEVFGDEIKAARWLSTPSPDFGGKVPLQIAQMVDYVPSEIERLFEPVFVRIEEGIYW